MSRSPRIPQQQANLSKVVFDSILCGGGLDQVTPTLSLKNGVARQALNFECGVNGGYTRIGGYERFDGQTSPSGSGATGQIISVGSFVNVPTVGDTITSSGGASGYIVKVEASDLRIWMAKITGTFASGHSVSVSGTEIGTIDSVAAGPSSTKEVAQLKALVSDVYRVDIQAVPGSGPVRGVVQYNDVVYAFRNNSDGTACSIYKSSSSGWVNVQLYKTVSFTAGTTAPAEGATLTQGSVTATIKRVVLQSGAWSGTAAGQLVITTPSGGNFSSGSASSGSTALTLSGAQSDISISPGGKYELIVANLTGSPSTNRIYGADGVNKLFEFDGDVYVPIATGASPDTPSHLVNHAGYLFVGIKQSIMYCAPGLPYNWTALSGAGEIALGDYCTGLITLPGGTTTSTLGVFTRSNTFILYGNNPASFNFVAYNTGTGAVSGSLQNMAQTFAFDDRGVVSIQTAIQYGNFDQSTLTAQILPFIKENINKCTASTLCRGKSQYRVFFSGGSALYITVVNGKSRGCMPVFFPDPVYCAFEGKTSWGEDVNFFGSDNGYVYQLDKGASFDGKPMDWMLVLNYANSKSPRILKRYRKASVELQASEGSYTTLEVGYSLGYGSSEYSQPLNTSYSLDLTSLRWDNFVWDAFFWDSKSLAPLEVELGGTAENIAIAIYGSSDSVDPFTINSIIMHYSPRRLMR